MVAITKYGWVNLARSFFDHQLSQLPLPRVHPNVVSALSVLVSIAILFINDLWGRAALLVVVLLLDWLDGVIARKYNFPQSQTIRGWLADVIADRASEIIFALIYPLILVPLTALNIFLSIYSFRVKRHCILPLRQALLIYWLATLFF